MMRFLSASGSRSASDGTLSLEVWMAVLPSIVATVGRVFSEWAGLTLLKKAPTSTAPLSTHMERGCLSNCSTWAWWGGSSLQCPFPWLSIISAATAAHSELVRLDCFVRAPRLPGRDGEECNCYSPLSLPMAWGSPHVAAGFPDNFSPTLDVSCPQPRLRVESSNSEDIGSWASSRIRIPRHQQILLSRAIFPPHAPVVLDISRFLNALAYRPISSFYLSILLIFYCWRRIQVTSHHRIPCNR
jgi:hypothetical protein